MKLIIKLPALLLLLCFSCNRQNGSKDINPQIVERQSKPTAIGKPVTELDNNIMVIFQDSQNNYWFGGSQQGVYKYDGKNLVLLTEEDGVCSKAILGIQEDKLGNIYFDTTEGVCQFDGQQVTMLEVIEKDFSKQDWQLNPDDLWFRMGWDKSGPYRYDGQNLYALELPKTEQGDKFHALYPNASFSPYGVYSIYRDSKGSMWFGTSSVGVCRFDGATISWIYEDQMTNTPEGGALGIRSVLEDKDGYFWFTNTRYCYDILPGSFDRNETNFLRYNKQPGIGYSNEKGRTDYPYFMSIVEDHKGDLWMVTYSDGVWRNDGEKLIHYPIMDGKKKVLLFSIYKDNKGDLWLGTHNAGVYKYQGGSFVKFAP